MFLAARRSLVLLPFVFAACSGGGDSGATSPTTVATIVVSGSPSSATVGSTAQYSAVAKNATRR